MDVRRMIPCLIHQTWNSRQLPVNLDTWCASWRRLNPGAEYRFYDDGDCRSFVGQEFPSLLGLYDSLAWGIERSDLFRLLVVYRYGGLYADVDMECLRSFTQFFLMDGALFCVEARLTRSQQARLRYAYPYQIANCIFAAVPGHPLLGDWIAEIERRTGRSSSRSLAEVEERTGPRLLTRLLFQSSRRDVQILEQIYWMAPTLYPNLVPFNRYMFARHHFLGSWKDRKVPSLRRRWRERSLWPSPWPGSTFHPFAGPE